MNYFVQCCSLIIIATLIFFDIRQKKVGLATERIAVAILFFNVLSIVCRLTLQSIADGAGADGADAMEVIAKIYYTAIIFQSFIMVQYILATMGKDNVKYRTFFEVPFAAAEVGIILTHLKFTVGGIAVYVEGPGAYIAFGLVSVYSIAIAILAAINKKRLGNRRKNGIVSWMVILLCATMVQGISRFIQVYSFGCALGVMILYVIVENPESNMDKYFGCFNSHILNSYMAEMKKKGKKYSAIYLSMVEAAKNEESGEEINDSLRGIIDMLNQHSGVRVFKNIDQEFIAIMPNEKRMNSLYHEVINRFFYDQYSFFGSSDAENKVYGAPVSLIVLVPDSNITENPEDILQVLREIREENRDNITTTTIELNQSHFDELKRKKAITEEIENALVEDRVEVFYQPIYSIAEGKFISAEALARIRRRDNSIMVPEVFVPLAEENGMILKIGERVFEKTCRFLKTGEPAKRGIKYIEVNLSVVQCEQPDLASKYIEIMKRYDIDPSMINLEITETASIKAQKKLQQNMNTLIDYGVEFSLDDFGNGHSNLDYIVNMPVDIIKLDMSLIQAYDRERKAKAVVTAAVRMISDMELRALTEGVETREQLDEMIRIGVKYIQGYYFSRPIPEQDFLKFLENHQAKG